MFRSSLMVELWVSLPLYGGAVLDDLACGMKQAGAEKGYNPKKPGRPSHHPRVLTVAETGDLIGVRWRPGSASAAAGATKWLELLVARLRKAGVEEITVRLHKGYSSRATVECLEGLGVPYMLKVRDHHWVQRELSGWRRSAKSREITKDPAVSIWSSSGTLYGARLLSLEWRRRERAEEALFASENVVR